MDMFRPRWIGSIAASLMVGLCLAFYLRDSSVGGNFSSILGLWVSLVGFAITIYTMLQTRTISRESQRRVEEAVVRAEQAVNDAEEQFRRGTDLIRREVWKSDHARLTNLLKAIRAAVDHREWQRALICVEEAPRLTKRLAAIADLVPGDREQFLLWAEELGFLDRFIRKYRMNDQEGGLKQEHEIMIVTFLGRLDAMEAKSLENAVGGGR